MQKGSVLFLRVVIVLAAIVALAVMIRFPQTEGRAANLDLISIYKDPFIIYLYIASIPFFVGLFQAFMLLGYVDKNERSSSKSKIFSQASVGAVKSVKYCALALAAFIVAAVGYIFVTMRGKDDIAGGVAGGLFIIFVSIVIAASAAVFQKILENAVGYKKRK